jgi:predicted metal-dependent enzyme (double-stranded beta helix superfamily)
MSSTTTITPTLQSLVEDLDLAVRRSGSAQSTVDAVSEALRPALTNPELLAPEHRIPDPIAYRQHLLHVAPDGAFSLVALVWLPGQETPIHDHLAWCVVGIHEGVEYETRYRLTRRGTLVAAGEAVALPGEVAGLLPPGDIHRVHNVGDTLAISLHVYGADLRDTGSSIRRRYDHPVRSR